MILKPGILLLEEAPHMFRNMVPFLLQKGFEIHMPKDFKEAQELLKNEKINIVIYSMGKQKTHQDLYNKILKYDLHMPSIRLDPSQEYTDPTNVFQSEHLILRHLGPKETFTNIIHRLTYIRTLKLEAIKTSVGLDKLKKLQVNIMGKSKADAYNMTLDFLANEFKAEKAVCWYYLNTKDTKSRTESKKDHKSLLWRETNPKEAYDLAQLHSTNKVVAESIKLDNQYLLMPVTNKEQTDNLCFFALKNPAGFNSSNFAVIETLYKEVCHILKVQEKLYEVEELSFVDEVTGLYNQRYLHLVLDQEIEKVKRDNTKFTVLFIDVDHFKNVNDTNGHLVGSQILKEIGKILKINVRSVDYCFRYGGDEFMVVLSGANTEQATVVAERIRKQIDASDFVIDGAKVHVTLSIGIACFPEHAKTKKKIIQVADAAMYCGKNLTRNIVYVAS